MTHELAALAALFKPHMQCVWRAPGHAADRFFSENKTTPGSKLLVQRNYGSGSEEIIVYAYDSNVHRYVRSLIADDGSLDAATSPGPSNGVWRFTGKLPKSKGKPVVVSWKRSGAVSRYWYEGVAGMGECR